MRRRSVAAVLGLAVVLALMCLALEGHRSSRPRYTYAGLNAPQWEVEIQHWVPWLLGSGKGGHWRDWARKEELPMPRSGENNKMLLLRGDREAVPVLIELLRSGNPRVRLLAAEGLEKVGEQARLAVPALLQAIEDSDDQVRQQAEQSLFWIDRETAEKVGLESTPSGLSRRERIVDR